MNEIKVAQKVWNPDFVSDLMFFVSPKMTQPDVESTLNDIKEKKPTSFEKLQTLTDRIEFIEHLCAVKTEAKRQKFQFGHSEIRGIGWDIDALRIYLALSCVDILSSNFQPFDAWILDNCSDFITTEEEIKTYLKRKSLKYREEFQISSNFIKSFTGAQETTKTQLTNNVTVQKKGKKPSSDIKHIAAYLYRVRNKYTHEGRRFFSEPINRDRIQAIGPRDEEYLEINKGFDIVNATLQVAKDKAARILKKAASPQCTEL